MSPSAGQGAAMDRFHRLPRWAQSELIQLRQAVKGLREQLDAVVEGEPTSRVTVDISGGADRKLCLPDWSRPRIALPSPEPRVAKDRNWIEMYSSRRDGAAVEVMASRQMSIHPLSANLLELRLRP